MSKRDEQAEIARVERAFKTLGDTLRRAAKNADALDLKPEVKAWLLDQFGQDKRGVMKFEKDKTLEYAGEVVRQQLELEQQTVAPASDKHLEVVLQTVRQQWELEQRAKPTSGKNTENEQRRRKSKQDGGDLPSH